MNTNPLCSLRGHLAALVLFLILTVPTRAGCECGCGGTPRPFCAHRCGGNPCTEGVAAPAAVPVASTCGCGCKGTPRPACAHSCKGDPCAGGPLTAGRVLIGEVVEGREASFTALAPNGNVLAGVVVEFDDGQKVETDENGVGTVVPGKSGKLKVGLVGGVITAIQVLSERQSDAKAKAIPRVASAGGLLTLCGGGLFDGSLESTTVDLEGQSCTVLAESPHQAIVQIPAGLTPGTRQLTVKEGDREFVSRIDICTVGISADRLKLKRGESTQGRVRIEGLSLDSAGCSLRVSNLSPSTIRVRPGTGAYTYDAPSRLIRNDAQTPRQEIPMKAASPAGDTFVVTLTEAMVRRGAIEVPFSINSIKTGTFSVVATVADPANSQKATCTCGCKGTPRPACAHSCGGDPCTG